MSDRPIVLYVPRATLYPSFGVYFRSTNHIEVREDLPSLIKDFVLDHEIYHSADTSNRHWLIQEMAANWYALNHNAVGGILAALYSLSPARILFYAHRFRKGR